LNVPPTYSVEPFTARDKTVAAALRFVEPSGTQAPSAVAKHMSCSATAPIARARAMRGELDSQEENASQRPCNGGP